MLDEMDKSACADDDLVLEKEPKDTRLSKYNCSNQDQGSIDNIAMKNEVDVENISNDQESVLTPEENGSTSQEIPLELQCEEVNMEDPDMDPLEWSVRKLVPIPKVYYWETGNENLTIRTKMWHQVVSRLGSTLRTAERLGETVANFFGLNSSNYDYVTSTMTEEQWELAKKNAEEQKTNRQKYEESQRKLADSKELSNDLGVTSEAL